MQLELKIIDWGLTAYSDAMEQQKAIVASRKLNETSDHLIFTEHLPVYTLGLRKNAHQHLLWTDDQRNTKNISIYKSNRGGDVTYHGPGQVVCYPIISLNERRDLHAYLRDLEKVVIQSLNHFSLKTGRREGKTGIWIEDRKICAIGVAVRSWITYHGFALNVQPDMEHFKGIIPCGITDGSVTSMCHELGYDVKMSAVKERLAVEFQNIFQNTSRQDAKQKT